MEDDIGEAGRRPSVARNRTGKLRGGSRIAQGSSGVHLEARMCDESVRPGVRCWLANGFLGFVGWVALHARKEGLREWCESRKGAGHGRPS